MAKTFSLYPQVPSQAALSREQVPGTLLGAATRIYAEAPGLAGQYTGSLSGPKGQSPSSRACPISTPYPSSPEFTEFIKHQTDWCV